MFNHFLDRLGMSISVLCMIHCLLFPLLVLLLPVLASTLFVNETVVHWILLGIAFPVSLFAFGHGYRVHGDWMTLVAGVFGLALLMVGVSHWLGHESEFYLTVPGALLLFVAHLRNWRHHLGKHQHKPGPVAAGSDRTNGIESIQNIENPDSPDSPDAQESPERPGVRA